MKSKNKNSIQANKNYINYLWLIIGCIFLLFMGGKWNILIATWIAPVFLLRYFRMQRSFRDILISLPFILIASYIFFLGLAVQVTFGFQMLITISYTFYILIPCLIDKFLYKKVSNSLISSLIYPASLVAIQFLLSYVGGLGTTLHWTGNLFSMKPLMQLVSITGVFGPSFLVGWFASIVNILWEKNFKIQEVKKPLAVFVAVFVIVMLYGGVLMTFFAPESGTVKVGSVIVGLPEDNLFYKYLDLSKEDQIKQKEIYRKWSHEVQDELFATSEELADSGIKILAWPSGNAIVFSEDEPEFTKQLQEFAKEHEIYFFPSLLVLGNYTGPDRNKVFAINPDGEIEYTHFKGRNPDAGYFHGEIIEFIDTPYGRIASPICYEMEFHRLIRQAGKNRVDIFIVPGDEPSKQVAIFHTELSMLRGIENGASVLRTTLEGLTMGIDYQGRILSQMNYYNTKKDRTIITELPIKGKRTIYNLLGDWFAYLSFLFLITIIIFVTYNKIKRKSSLC